MQLRRIPPDPGVSYPEPTPVVVGLRLSAIRFLSLMLACLSISSSSRLSAEVVLSEFLASNIRNLADDDGAFEDWIEVYNNGAETVSLDGWYLTDTAKDLRKWRLPATNISGASSLLIFASNKDRRQPGRTLHTNFKLTADGEFLALVKPDGITTTTVFSPTYPPQAPDISYGSGLVTTNLPLVTSTSPRRVLVPSAANGGTLLADTWKGSPEPFNDSAWIAATGAVGYSGMDAALVAADGLIARYSFDHPPSGKSLLDSKPLGTPRPATNNNALWLAGASDGASVSVTRSGVMQFMTTSNSQITVSPNADINIARGSVAFWVRSSGTTGTGSQGAVLLERRTSTAGFSLYQLDNGTLRFFANAAASRPQNAFVSVGGISDDRWHHVTLAFDQSSNAVVSLYIDGILSGSNRNTNSWAWPNSSVLSVGRPLDAASAFRKFNGHLDDLRLYNRILTPEEVVQVYQGDGGISAAEIALDLTESLRQQNTSAFVRIPFVMENPALITALSLRMRYDDGYVAWLNGRRVGSANAPEAPAWDSSATAEHSAGQTDTLLLSAAPGTLRQGNNILSIQALNSSLNDATFLIAAELVGFAVLQESASSLYFTQPTPGKANGAGSKQPGPAILDVQHRPSVPRENEDLVVTARISAAFSPLSNVILRYQVQFNPVVAVTMLDNGLHGDGAAGDGVFGASVPASVSTHGQMIRYFVSASDLGGSQSRWPLFNSPLDSPEYLGTVVSPETVQSQLPVFHLFVSPQNLPLIDGETGGRLSVFHDGEFYDNVYMELRGNTSAGLPKKSHRLEFHRQHPLRHPGPGKFVRKTSFIAEHLDPAYVRQGLSFWLLNETGTPAPFYYPARLELNGAFYQLASHTDVLGEDQLERMGYDPNGALYKAVGTISADMASSGGVEKKTRTFEGNADYVAMANGISESRPLGVRRTNAFETLDIPNVINYLACARWVQEADDVWANMTLYRDSDGDKLWRVIPFDMNLSWGALYYGDNSSLNAGVVALDDTNKSHPLYGGQAIIAASGGNWNRLYDVIISVPETRQMLLRRMRTIMDNYIQPPSTHPLLRKFEARIYAMTNAMWAEAFIDRAKWGWPDLSGPYGLGPNQWLTNATQELVEKFIQPRRTHWYVTHSATNLNRPIGAQPTAARNAGIPDEQAANATLDFGTLDPNPSSGDPAGEYLSLINSNPFAVDVSDWRVSGAIRFQFKGGTVIPSNSTLYVARDLNAFRARQTSPRGGQGLFVVGPYDGQLSARGETLVLTDDRGRSVTTNSYIGNPTAAQRALRVTEVMYHPSVPPTGSPFRSADFEYIELRNIDAQPLDLNGVHFTNGLTFAFSGSAVTSLSPGERVLVVHSRAAFVSRHGSQPRIAGEFTGSLDNNGERIVLHDGAGEVVVDFQFRREWLPLTDGPGYSLAIQDDTLPYSDWSRSSSWRLSGSALGSPGSGDGALNTVAPVLINEIIPYPVSGRKEQVELYNPTDKPVSLSGWHLSDDFLEPRKYRFPNGTVIASKGYHVLSSDDFEASPGVPGAFAFDNSGDHVYLFSGDANGELTGYQHGFAFGATARGWSLGRHLNSLGEEALVPQATATMGAANSGPLLSPVVISEIHYHPAPQAPSESPLNRQFVELRNVGQSTAFLFDLGTLTNTWRLRGDVDFDFPTNVSVLPGGILLLVGFDPAIDVATRQQFTQEFGLPPGVRMFGPFRGNLSNKSGKVRLSQPVVGGDGVVDHAGMDEVNYEDEAPWPIGADGRGASLHRRTPAVFGNDPLAWADGIPTPGAPQAVGSLPQITLQPSSRALLAQTEAQLIASASSTGPLVYQWLRDGEAVPGGRSALLSLPYLLPQDSGDYVLAVVGATGTVFSQSAKLEALLPAFFNGQPQGRFVLAGTNVTFAATVVGTGSVRYQWRKDGQAIPGAIETSLRLSGVQPFDNGVYDVVVTDDLGTVASARAALVVSIKPSFLLPPQAITVVQGQTAVIFATVNGTTPLTYRWTRNDRAFTNITVFENTGVIRIPNAHPTNSATFALTVTNLGGATVLSPKIQLTILADSDRDGMADIYETANGFNPNEASDAESDADGDGMSNRAEAVAGTSPKDPASFLGLSIGARDPGIILSFFAISNRSYTLQQRGSLGATVWQKAVDISTRTNNRLVEILQTNGLPDARLYRVVVPAQP